MGKNDPVLRCARHGGGQEPTCAACALVDIEEWTSAEMWKAQKRSPAPYPARLQAWFINHRARQALGWEPRESGHWLLEGEAF